MVRGNDAAFGGGAAPEGLLSTPESRGYGEGGVKALIDRARAMPEQIDRVNNTFVGFVREQPLVALGAACAAGYVLGRMLRRVV